MCMQLVNRDQTRGARHTTSATFISAITSPQGLNIEIIVTWPITQCPITSDHSHGQLQYR